MKNGDKTMHVCSFIGHRKIENIDSIKEKLKQIITHLITYHNVDTFLFGSRSDFNAICHLVVNELKLTYPQIKRIAYTCTHETCNLERDKKELQKLFCLLPRHSNQWLYVDEEVKYKTKFTSGKASYILRNKAMIDNSGYCVFFFDTNYNVTIRKSSNNSYQKTKSGTQIAYQYAKQKKKHIINIADLNTHNN